MSLGRALARVLAALRVDEDARRFARLVRRRLGLRRLAPPSGPPGPPSPELCALLAADDRTLDVAAGALLIAEEDEPGIDVRYWLREVEALAAGLRARLRGLSGARERLAATNRYFFAELGFVSAPHRGTRRDEDRLAYLLLPGVLDRRAGHCVGLSTAYLALGYRAGLPVFGVSAPGHFFVRWDGEGLRQNVELTALGAGHPDEYYVARFGIGAAQVDRGVYLQNLRRREVLVEILNNRANYYWDRGDEERAARDLDRVVTTSHNYARALAGRGFLHLQRGHPEEALTDLRKALAIDPDYARAHLLSGQAYMQQGWLERARACFEHAVRLDGSDALAATYLGRIHAMRRDHEEALRWHERAIASDPRCHVAWTQLGRTRLALGQTDEAGEAFREALRLAPHSLAARECLALLARRRRRRSLTARAAAARLRRRYEALLRSAPENDLLRVRYARFLLEAGLDADRALALLGDVVARKPTAYHLELLSRALSAAGRREEALAHLARAQDLDAERGGVEAARLEGLRADLRGDRRSARA
ncbi:MAG: tetratricopeptide repeat protein [Planctomycetota bacterium]|nr:MAG: tetratricopeptide repeat protein [Planctomycetota bacterium]